MRQWLLKKLIRYLSFKVTPKKDFLCDFDRALHEIRPADIILVEGRSRFSRIIKNITQSPWTHAALYVGRLHDIEDVKVREDVMKLYQGNPNEKLIIESFPGMGTVIRSIRVHKSEHIRICRPTGLDHRDAQKVIQFAAEHIGNPYDIRHVFDLARFYLSSIFIPARWQSVLFNYKPNQTTKDVCSVLIADAFASIKFPVLPLIREDKKHHLEIIRRNPWLCTPCDFEYSPYFDIIKYPMIPSHKGAHYKNLPWREDLISNDDVGIYEHETTKKPKSTKKTKNAKSTKKNKITPAQ